MARLLVLARILLAEGRPTVHELAARFHTRRETIYRDLRTLQDAGFPILGDESGRLSRPRLDPDFGKFVPPVHLTDEEVAALQWAGKQAGARNPFRGALSTALTKLQGLVPGTQARLAIALDGAVGGWERGIKSSFGQETTILKLVEAIVGRRRCLVASQSPGRRRPNGFRFDPYRLLHVQGGLYCAGLVPVHKAVIILAVERLRSLEMTAEAFVVDPSFDPKGVSTSLS
jgi:hypothetical protein